MNNDRKDSGTNEFSGTGRDVKFLVWVVAAAVIGVMLLLGACA